MKIMLDQCVTQAAAYIVIQFLQSDPDVDQAEFSVDYIGSGAKDLEIGNVTGLEHWHVITGDNDRKHKNALKRLIDGPPLHLILPQKHVSAVYMSGSIQLKPTTEKARAIISTWPKIKEFFRTASPGSKSTLHKKGDGYDLMIY